MKIIQYILGLPLLVLIYFYKLVISPLTPASCRHYPTCSEYSVQAIRMHGPLRGSWMAIKRIASCHPWGSSGIDPVPRIIVKKIKTARKGKTVKIDPW
jgi:putative membrane protein insertion efficiency factor